MTQKSKNIAVVGAGVWGTTLGNLLLQQRHKVKFWSRSSSETLAATVENVQLILLAVSVKGVKPVVDKLQGLNLASDVIIITATKGLDTLSAKTPWEILTTTFPHHAIVVLSGPNLSKEISQGLPAATVIASKNKEAAETVQGTFAGDNFRVYLNDDPLGVSLGGTLKNIMAIASGVCDGLDLGTNAKSALLTRALPEMIRVGNCLGAFPETFFGLSGLGDLLATCNSPLSRNYQVGYRLAKGQSLEEILAHLEGTAEGINTTHVLMEVAKKYDLYVPISHQVYRLLTGKITPQEAVKSLMERHLKPEFINLKDI